MVGRQLLALLLPLLFGPCSAWGPSSWSGSSCFNDPVFNETAGGAPLRLVDDPRMQEAVAALLSSADGGSGGKVLLPGGETFYGEPRGSLVLEVNEWDTHFLTTMAAAILLRERLGYRVAVLRVSGASDTFRRMSRPATNSSGLLDRTNVVHANMEVWPASKQRDILANNASFLGNTGATGQSGLYVDAASVESFAARGASLDHWRALERCDVLAALTFDSLPLELVAANTTGAKCGSNCNDGGAFVTPALKRGDACVNVSSMCATDSSGVKSRGGVLLAMDPLYDEGWMQEMVSNLNLSLRIPFVGYAAAQKLVAQRTSAGDSTLFYHWEPDLFHAQHEGRYRRVTFPHSTLACKKQRGDLSQGLETGGANSCDFASEQLAKYAAPDLEATAGSAVVAFLSHFQVNDPQLVDLLRRYDGMRRDNGSDGTNHFRAACAWLRENEALWQPWVTAAAATAKPDSTAALSDGERAAWQAGFDEMGGGAGWNNCGDKRDDPCGCDGVKCEDGDITSVSLPENGMSGTLPKAFGALTDLKALVLCKLRPAVSVSVHCSTAINLSRPCSVFLQTTTSSTTAHCRLDGALSRNFTPWS